MITNISIDFLKQNKLILFEVISGSRAFGLDTPTSDTDIKGVFYLPREYFYGLNYVPQVSNESNDIVYYELGRFVELLLKNNPNLLEVLASSKECILYKHPIMDHLTMDIFLSKLTKDTFINYAITQIKKAKGLNKKINNPVDIQRKDILEFCYVINNGQSYPLVNWLKTHHLQREYCGLVKIAHCRELYALFYDDSRTLGYHGITQCKHSHELSLSSVTKEQKNIAYMTFNQDGYSSHCREYKEYWSWVKKRNQQRYKENISDSNNFDAKNMMHTIRLLQVAQDIVNNGVIVNKRPNRTQLLNIRNRRMSYDEIIQLAENILIDIEQSHKDCLLADTPDRNKVEKILINMREQLYSN